MMGRGGGNHEMMVRGHEHDGGLLVSRHGGQEQIIVHRSQASQDSNHDGIMDLAQHSDHSN